MRRLMIVLLAMVVIGAAVGGWWRWLRQPGEQARRQLTLYGNVDIREVQLAFNASDRIASMPVKEGDHVRKGQLVATLDRTLSQAAVNQARAQVAAQQQVVARLLAGSRPQEIARARADVASAAAWAHDTRLTYQQTRALLKKNAATRQEMDHALAARNQAVAQLQSLQQTLNLAVLGPRKEDIAQAKATLKADQAILAQARQRLANTRLVAPADGIIRDRILEVGDMASPRKPVYTLALTNPLWVRAYVPEPDLGKLHLGTKAQVTTDSYPGKVYHGWVGYISPTAEFTPQTVQTSQLRTALVYEVRIYVKNPQNQLRLGMPATVTIPLSP